MTNCDKWLGTRPADVVEPDLQDTPWTSACLPWAYYFGLEGATWTEFDRTVGPEYRMYYEQLL
jgi:hypothetical protein